MPTGTVNKQRKRHRRSVRRCLGWAAVSVLLLVPLLAVPAAAQSAGSDAGPAAVSVDRFGGADRYATSLAVAEGVAADAGGSLASVVIVSGERWRDAVVAAPLAAAGGSGSIAPILLSHSRTGLSADAWAFIERVRVGGAVIVSTDAAGRRAVPGSVDDGLRERGVGVQRLGGSDAYATSVAVAEAVSITLSSSGSQGSGGSSGAGGTVFVASGESFADALVAGPLVGNVQAAVPLLLTPKAGLDAAVSGWLTRHKPARAVIMGGTAAVSAQVESEIEAAGVGTLERIAGSDRFDTAAKAAAWAATHIAPGCGGPGEAGLARSDVPFDSFSAGPLLALRCAPLLLTAPGRIPDATAAALDTALDRASPQDTPRLSVFGGEAAVSTAAINGWLDPADGDQTAGDEVPAAAIATAEQQMARLVNALRASVGLDALTVSAEIAGVARGWSRTMLATGEFEHNPNYSVQYPPGWLSSGENVATASGYPSIDDAVEVMFDGLVDSPGHYANMTSPAFTHIGIGIASDGDKHYATQNFAAYSTTQPSGAGSSNGTVGTSTPDTSTVAALEAPPALSPGLAASVGTTSALRTAASARWWDTSVFGPKSGIEVVTVFLCDLDGDSRNQDMHAATKTLNDRVSPFYKWQSSGAFQFIFEPGAVLRPNSASTCLDAAQQHASSDSYVVIARGIDAAANTGFGWAGERASKAAVVIGSDGPTGLEVVVSQQYRRTPDYHLISVIDALAHTQLGVGFYSNRFAAEQDGTPLVAGCVSPILGILGDLEVPSLVSQQNPSGYTVRLSCWEIGLLGWPSHGSFRGSRDGNCSLLPAEGVKLKTRDIGEESVKLTWHAPEARPYSHPLAAFRIEHYEYLTGNEDSIVTPKSVYRVDTDVREFTITGMSPVKAHEVHVYTEYKPMSKQFTLLDSKLNPQDIGNDKRKNLTFSPRARSATAIIAALRPTVQDADKVTPSDLTYSMKWEPHPEAVEYRILGLGDSTFTRYTELGLETSEISGSTGGSILRTSEYRIDGWLNQLAFDTEYDIVVLACVPVRFVNAFSSSPDATTCFEYIRKPFTTPTEQEFREYVASFAPPVFDPNWTPEDIVWDHSVVAPTDVPSNLQIMSVSRHHDSADAPNALVLTFAWEEASGADTHRIYNPTRNEPVPSDATDFESHIWSAHAYHYDSSPQKIVMMVDLGSSVMFEYEACNVSGRWPNGWPASYVCGPTQTAVLPIPQP